jgi:hypothetical protein
MAIFVAVNFLGVRLLAGSTASPPGGRSRIPLLTIFVLAATHFHGSNFGAAGGFMPFGFKGCCSAISGSGIIFALLGFEQAIQLAGESENPKKDMPRATILSILIGAAIYILLQVVYIGALPAANFVQGLGEPELPGHLRPVAGLATLVGLGWLAWSCTSTRSSPPEAPALIYTTSTSRVSYGLSRNGYVPKIYENRTRDGVPWFGLITAFVAGCICFLPFPSWQQLVGLHHLGERADVRGRAAGVRRVPQPAAGVRERPFKLPGGQGAGPALVRRGQPDHLLDGLGHRLQARRLHLHRLSDPGALAGVQRQPDQAAARLQGRAVASGVPDRHAGHHVAEPGLRTASRTARAAGALPSHAWFGFGWDMLAVAVFSMVIYYWAQAVALPTERIQEMIDEVVVDEQATVL